jgi:peptidoglycan/LPS O-acetylase OafA/YrhL
VASSVVLVAALAGLGAALIDGSRVLGQFTWLLTPVLIGLATWASVSRRLGWALQALAFAPLAFFGRISYSFYLYHLPVLILFNLYLPGAPPLLALPLYLAVMLPLAWASWRYVELPFMSLRQGKPRHA